MERQAEHSSGMPVCLVQVHADELGVGSEYANARVRLWPLAGILYAVGCVGYGGARVQDLPDQFSQTKGPLTRSLSDQ